MLIRSIQQRAKPGNEIVITLVKGGELRGVLVEITDECVVIDNDEGQEFLRESEIARFKIIHNKSMTMSSSSVAGELLNHPEVLSTDGRLAQSNGNSPHNTNITVYEPESDEPKNTTQSSKVFAETNDSINKSSGVLELSGGRINQPKIEPEQQGIASASSISPAIQSLIETPKIYPLDFLTTVIEIQARFQEGARHAKLQPFAINMMFPGQEVEDQPIGHREHFRNQWIKIYNSYKYAVQIRDFNRLNQIAESIVGFINFYPWSVHAHFNLAAIYQDINRLDDARRVYAITAQRFNYPQAWYNLAALTLQRGDRNWACYALQKYFRHISLGQNIASWFCCANLLIEYKAINVFMEMLIQAVDEQRIDDVRILADTFIYVFKCAEHDVDALRLVAYMRNNAQLSEEIIVFINTILESLGVRPTPAFTNARAEIELLATQPLVKNITLQPQQKSSSPSVLPPPFVARRVHPSSVQDGAKSVDGLDAKLVHSGQNSYQLQRKGSYNSQTPPPKSSLSSGVNDTPLSRARIAQLQQRDYKLAEKLYRQAIEEGDNIAAAVKDLASLLRQQNRTPEAITLLLENMPQEADQVASQNLLADMYQHSGQYAEAIEILRMIADTLHPKIRRVNPLKRIAYCCFKLEEFDQAERELNTLLELSPNDTTALRWLYSLREAKRSGLYSDLNTVFIIQSELMDFSTSISKFLEYFLEQCRYVGVPEAQVNSRNFSEEDLRKLAGLIEGAGRRRLKVRADYRLSAARLSIDLNIQNEAQIRSYLQDFAGDMGDATLLDQRSYDVVMAFFIESFAVSPQWTSRLTSRLSQFMMLFYAPPETITEEKVLPPEATLKQALQTKRSLNVIEGLLELSLVNRQVAERLLPKIAENRQLCIQVGNHCLTILNEPAASIQTLEQLIPLWERGREFCRKRNLRIANEMAFLQSQLQAQGTAIDKIREHRLNDLQQDLRGQLDRKYLKVIEDILALLVEYGRQQQYIERERLATIIKNRIAEVIVDIEKNPTRHSLELFRPYLHALLSMIEEHFSGVQHAAEPDELKVTLAIEKYTPNDQDYIDCQITVSNEPLRSPASNVVIIILPSPGDEYTFSQPHIAVNEAIQGGQSVTCLLPIKVLPKTQQAQVFSLYYRLSFVTRTDRTINMPDQSLPIQLGSVAEFEEFENPYAAHSEGSAVKDPKMFFGRDILLDRLVKSITQTKTNKSFVIYGQKRTGKSSVLYHLKRRLLAQFTEVRIIPIDFSTGDIATELSMAIFLYRIIQRIQEMFEDELPLLGLPTLQLTRPSLVEFQVSPQLMFADYMAQLRRTLDRHPDYAHARLVLLVDEFSYIYGEILRGHVPDTFMKAWKAMLEQDYFGSVLAGQELMSQFIEAYPNEFQVAQTERVNYLAYDDARNLIVDPIRVPETKENRYRGSAVDKLINLTAGSPFYIQIFCNRLVDYMHRKRVTYVTDADIHLVATEDLLRGTNRLGQDKFDNLINTGFITTEDVLTVLRLIALGTRTQSYCDQSNLTAQTSIPIDTILNDLVAHEVLERQGSSLYRIRVGLFHRWLLGNS